MLAIQNTEHFRIESPSIVTIGTFDGVHLGHQKILKRLLEIKKQTGYQTVVLTFEPHPRKVLFPEQKDLKLISTVDEKLDLLKHYGVDITVVYPFSKAFSQLDSEVYIREILIKQLRVKHLVIGYDHKFGKNRSGDLQTLKTFAPGGGFELEEISPLDIDAIAVSSSKIRKALDEGDITRANEYLGHSFGLEGTVVKGKQLGRTLGYATANIQVDDTDKLIPKMGVYVVQVALPDFKGYGMMSIGLNPTTDNDERVKLEVHIFDFNQDIYGKTLQLKFIGRLRDEKKFANLTELKTALDEDKRKSLQLISL